VELFHRGRVFELSPADVLPTRYRDTTCRRRAPHGLGETFDYWDHPAGRSRFRQRRSRSGSSSTRRAEERGRGLSRRKWCDGGAWFVGTDIIAHRQAIERAVSAPHGVITWPSTRDRDKEKVALTVRSRSCRHPPTNRRSHHRRNGGWDCGRTSSAVRIRTHAHARCGRAQDADGRDRFGHRSTRAAPRSTSPAMATGSREGRRLRSRTPRSASSRRLRRPSRTVDDGAFVCVSGHDEGTLGRARARPGHVMFALGLAGIGVLSSCPCDFA